MKNNTTYALVLFSIVLVLIWVLVIVTTRFKPYGARRRKPRPLRREKSHKEKAHPSPARKSKWKEHLQNLMIFLCFPGSVAAFAVLFYGIFYRSGAADFFSSWEFIAFVSYAAIMIVAAIKQYKYSKEKQTDKEPYQTPKEKRAFVLRMTVIALLVIILPGAGTAACVHDAFSESTSKVQSNVISTGTKKATPSSRASNNTQQTPQPSGKSNSGSTQKNDPQNADSPKSITPGELRYSKNNESASPFKIISMSRTVSPGDEAYITITTPSKKAHHISVYYDSGPSTADGLVTQTSKNGKITWRWKVGTRTHNGTYPIIIYDGSDYLKTTFTVN